MKKRILLNVIVLITIVSCGFIAKHSYQKTLLPKTLRNFYLGMELADFSKIKDLEKLEKYDAFNFRVEYAEKFKDAEIKEVTYYFTKEKPQILYEFIIEYQSNVNVPFLAKERYGKPNSDEEWLFDSREGFDIKIWTFNQTIVVAGKLPGTEWE
ncbi:MAG: hypothetical protein K9N09_06545 [Candidatus Cloacimonetes bacterium]|nr:hypothetical protein [Candidatus Cloacimonadota bacterium]MCF7813787.1 hypothetical protein [Candidatus Cloacimonadota bacterium]MCF7868341.1 hypothetical protein [Candidatus Cloacimonadota bacterium]MCF7883815.1 hypothetical protein [Candidatus Cloacimonadota bacterium]